MMRVFLGTLGALGTWSAIGAGQYARATLIVGAVVAAAGLELVVGLVRRKLSTPPARPRATS